MPNDLAILTPEAESTLWDARDVARYAKLSVRTVRQAAADGRLPCLRLPWLRAVRFDPEVVRAWAHGKSVAAGNVVSMSATTTAKGA